MSAEKKLHIIRVSDPLVSWNGLVAECGYTFNRAEPLWMFRDSAKPTDPWLQAFSMLMLCRECLRSISIESEGKREYIYGLVEQSARFLEGQAS